MSALGFCRDCFHQSGHAFETCPRCRSRRTVFHPQLSDLSIAHLDCDAFYAAVEKRDRPELRDRPVIVGGGERGVVTTACYLARVDGARSAMPMWQAKKLSPRSVIVRPDMAKYAREGLRIREMMRSLTPAVEPLSIDEAFLDLRGTAALHGAPPAVTMARLAARIEREVGITVSVGLSHNKYLAKVASDMNKPRGFTPIGADEAAAVLASRPVSVIWGVGESMGGRLARDGITHVHQLQAMAEEDLVRRYGSMGVRLARLSRGEDTRPVRSARERKSVSAETTFSTDIADEAELIPILRRQSERVSASLKEKGIAGRTLVLKLKTADFRQRTRNRVLPAPTQLADRIYAAALPLLRRELDGTRFRLSGVGVADLSPADLADPDDLIDPSLGKRAAAERAMDRVRERFGSAAVGVGTLFANPLRKKDRPDVIEPDERATTAARSRADRGIRER